MLYRPERWPETLDNLGKIRIVEQDAGLGMIDRIGDMLVGEPWIGGVEDIAHARHREKLFEVAVVVPGK